MADRCQKFCLMVTEQKIEDTGLQSDGSWGIDMSESAHKVYRNYRTD